VGKLVSDCQTVMCSTAARDDGVELTMQTTHFHSHVLLTLCLFVGVRLSIGMW